MGLINRYADVLHWFLALIFAILPAKNACMLIAPQNAMTWLGYNLTAIPGGVIGWGQLGRLQQPLVR